MNTIQFYLFLEPSVLNDWLGLLKPGGIACFTHKSQVWLKWESAQQDMVKSMKWEKLWQSNDLFYLPSCEGEDISTRVRVFLFKKYAT